MGTLAERLNTMTIRAASPDDSVRLYITGIGALHIEFVKDALERHTASTLSKQLSHVCTVAMQQRHRQMLMASGGDTDTGVGEADGFTRTRRPSFPDPDGPGITALGRSPEAVITVRRIPGGIFAVKVRKGTLGRYNAEQLAVELHRALLEASADYRLQLAAAFDDHESWPLLSTTVSASFAP